jgi:hypothetical protein
MNFKISFRTWLRHANIKIKKAAYTLLRQEHEYKEEKQSSLQNNSRLNKMNGREKAKGNALELLEKGLQKKFQK